MQNKILKKDKFSICKVFFFPKMKVYSIAVQLEVVEPVYLWEPAHSAVKISQEECADMQFLYEFNENSHRRGFWVSRHVTKPRKTWGQNHLGVDYNGGTVHALIFAGEVDRILIRLPNVSKTDCCLQ